MSALGLYSPAGESVEHKNFTKVTGLSTKGFRKPNTFNYFSYLLLVGGVLEEEMSEEQTILLKAGNYLYSVAMIGFGLASWDPMVVFDIASLIITIATDIFGLP